MRDYLSKVELSESINADTIAISKDRYFAKAYVIGFPLVSVPNHVWQDIFEREWRSSRYLWDRKLFVVADKLMLVTKKDDIEDKLDCVKQVTKGTKTSIDEYNRQEEARLRMEKGLQSWVSEEENLSIDMIRDSLRRRIGTF